MRALFTFVLGLLSVAGAGATIIANPAQPIDRQLVVQLIQARNNSGTIAATVFGSAAQRVSIEASLDQIWAQAGIDISILAPVTTYNSSFALNNNGNTAGERPVDDFDLIFSQASLAGVLNTGNVINAIFLDFVPGFPSLSENSAAGLASLPGDEITMFVGDNLLSFQNGRDVIASVFAHEIGHNLGLDHEADGSANLMAGFDGTSEQLSAQQIAMARSSTLLAIIPEPGTLVLLGPGLLLFALRRRLRRE